MDKVLGMIGMAKRAGNVCGGGFLCERAIKDGSSRLIIIANDISANSEKSIKNSCTHYNVKYIYYADKESLGNFSGGGEKSVISINDDNFANAVIDKYNQMQDILNADK